MSYSFFNLLKIKFNISLIIFYVIFFNQFVIVKNILLKSFVKIKKNFSRVIICNLFYITH